MPIYAYRCEECGFAKDVLQKMSDPQLTECPSCGKSTFKKQLTAAGFQLKGTGWYVTDYAGKNGKAAGNIGFIARSRLARAERPLADQNFRRDFVIRHHQILPFCGQEIFHRKHLIADSF